MTGRVEPFALPCRLAGAVAGPRLPPSLPGLRQKNHSWVSIKTSVLTIQFSSMEHDAFHVPYLLDTTPEAAFHGQAVKTVAYLRVSATQQVLGPEARPPEGLAGRLTARWQAGRYPALPRTGRFQDRHRQDHGRVPYHPLQLHEHPRAQAEPLACISTRILSVPLVEVLDFC